MPSEEPEKLTAQNASWPHDTAVFSTDILAVFEARIAY